MISARHLRKTLVAGVSLLALALLSPAALAAPGGHGRYNVHVGYTYSPPVRYAYRGPVYRPPARYYRAPVRYSYGYNYGYSHYRPSRHWGPGEVLGAVVAGAIITNVIADAVQPRTTVVERRVYETSTPAYPASYSVYPSGASAAVGTTRYIGPDDGYYDRRR